MRATDIIRAVLDILDQEAEEQHITVQHNTELPAENGEAEASRFKQIFAMLDNPSKSPLNPSKSPLSNAPNEVIAPVSAVTTDAGGGINGPKHPDDIRVKDPRGFE